MSTPATRQKKRSWERKLEQLAEAQNKAQEDLLVGICQAVRDGLSQADIAYMIGGLSPSGIGAKAAKGEKILSERKGGKGT